MKKLVGIWVLTLSLFGQDLMGQGLNGKREDKQITFDGKTRKYVVYIPSGYTGKTAVPLVMMFHGTGGDGDKFFKISGWKEKAEAEGFIAVFPSALPYCYIDEDKGQRRKSKWNDGKLETYVCPGTQIQDDVAFVRNLIRQLQMDYAIDPARIYASGFSNGANFVSRLAIELSDQLAAVSVVAGTLAYDFPQPKRQIPVYQLVGRQDDGLIEKNGGNLLPLAPDSLMNAITGDAIHSFLTALNLPDTYQALVRPKHTTLSFTNTYSSAEYRFSLVRGLEHRYPNGSNNPAGLVAADLFWNFFSPYSLP